tara:strand:+ start:2450 stop:3130 length:681 start_codon:yes stop_codon:yes gene_type:complete
MKHWYRLNIPINNAIKIDVKQECFNNTNRADVFIPEHGGIWTFGKDEIFNQVWIEEVKQRCPYLEVTGALVFWRAPGYQHAGAHIDVAPNNSPSRVNGIEYENGFHATNSSDSMDAKDFYPVVSSYNWILNDNDDSAMTWHTPLPNANIELKKFTDAVHYDEVPIVDCKEIDRCTVGNNSLVMVRTNVLHNVEMGDQERWAISARCIMGWSSWAEAVETLGDWIVE